MAEWSLDEVSYERYRQVKEKLTESEAIWLHGGFWRRFLKSHPESRWMYGRVVSLSRYLNNLALGIQGKTRRSWNFIERKLTMFFGTVFSVGCI